LIPTSKNCQEKILATEQAQCEFPGDREIHWKFPSFSRIQRAEQGLLIGVQGVRNYFKSAGQSSLGADYGCKRF
jgi:hypothetical protein